MKTLTPVASTPERTWVDRAGGPAPIRERRDSFEIHGSCQLTAVGDCEITVYGICEIAAFGNCEITVWPAVEAAGEASHGPGAINQF